jgi:type IV secretory pathway TrbD component
MSNGLIAFILGISVATWVYNKMYSRTGGNSQSAIVVAIVAGIAAAVVMLMVLSFIPG